MRIGGPALCLALSLVAGAAVAEQGRLSRDPLPAGCVDRMTTADMVRCAARHYDQAEARLNRIETAILEQTDAQGRELFREAQIAWTAFRDAECRRSADLARGGTLARVLASSCMAALTAERVRSLEADRDPESVPPPAFERPDGLLIADLDCDRVPEIVTLGLLPAEPETAPRFRARLSIDRIELVFPIGGATQDAFCGGDLVLSLVPGPTADACPSLRIEGGLCDAIYVRWDAAASGYVWERN